MAIPNHQSMMLPLLELAGDGQTRQGREAIELLAQRFGLTDDEKRELVPSGQQPRFQNRVSWARTHMTKAGLLESPKRGFFRITERGLQVLAEKPPAINVKFLEQWEEFRSFRKLRRKRTDPTESDNEFSEETPEENLEAAYQTIRENLADDILRTVRNCSPEFFEQLVVDLLVRMGYGGSRQEAGQAIGRSGDGGIDGIIKEDRLGLDIIYVQAKRWEQVVSRPEVQKFAGALQGQQAHKGVFITTSAFSREAIEYAKKIPVKIILIEGTQLAYLMIDYGIGVTTVNTYELQRIDSDYFE
jgi:restriction system protein